MRIENLTQERMGDFIRYCKSHRKEVDDSFLYDEDLKRFKLGEENPTYLLIDEEENIIGATSLIIDEYNKKGKKGRFRIFHSITNNVEGYRKMLGEILKHTEEINKIFVFVKEEDKEIINILNSLNFYIERYSFSLKRDIGPIEAAIFPEAFNLKTFEFNRDEEHWCEVRNAGFAKLKGSEAPRTPEMIREMQYDRGLIPGGMKILYNLDEPVGIVGVWKEIEEDIEYAFIYSLAVKPEFQGKALGKNLLRAALHYGKTLGIDRGMLTVNGENDKALSLYLKEGFYKDEVVICYNYDIR
ncbi:GNAT family N-acetyltransferase [Clostridium sp. Marseille-QA1073]